MERKRRIATWSGTILGICLALLLNVVLAHGSDDGAVVTEAFHQTYPLTANGRVELTNINGSVHISAWDRSEVKVDAVKTASDHDRLQEAEIRVDAHADSISIETQYRDNRSHEHTNPASVEYTLLVPRNARLDEITLINGNLEITGVNGDVHGSSINGKVTARNLSARTKLQTVNGLLDAKFQTLQASSLELSSVNGPIRLTLPSDASADLEVSTIHGEIKNNFGLRAIKHQWVGHDLRGELGRGGMNIHLDNVNGPIEILHADDGKALSPVHDQDNGDNKI